MNQTENARTQPSFLSKRILWFLSSLSLFLLIFGSGWMIAEAADDASLSINMYVPITNTPSGELFDVVVQYECSSLTVDCSGVQITTTLTTALLYQESIGSSHTEDISHSASDGLVIITLSDPIPAGSTGDILIRARFPNGSTPNGATTNIFSTIDGTNAAEKTSEPVELSAFSEVQYEVRKEATSENPGPDGTASYKIQLCYPFYYSGQLNVTSARFVDVLPPNSEFVSASGNGVYDSATHTVSWDTGNLNVYNRYSGSNSYKYCYDRQYITVRFPAAFFSIGDVIDNNAQLWGTPIGESVDRLIHEENEILTVADVNYSGNYAKWPNSVQERTYGESFSWLLHLSNTGNVTLDNAVITDPIPAATEVYRIHTGTYNSNFSLTVRYKTTWNSTWQSATGSPYTSSSWIYVGNVSSGIPLADGEYITELQFDYGSIPAGFSATSYWNNLEVYGRPLRTDHNGNAVNSGTVALNVADFEFSYNGNNLGGPDESSVLIIAEKIEADANIYDDPAKSYKLGDTVRFRALLDNDGYLDWDNPALVALLPEGMEYVENSYAPGNSTYPTPTFEQINNYNGTGQTLLRWKWEDGVNPWKICAEGSSCANYNYIFFEARITDETPDGETALRVDYWISTTGEEVDFDCQYSGERETDTNDYDDDGRTDDLLCNDWESLAIINLPSINSTLSIRGSLDSGFLTFPDVANTYPGDPFDIQLDLNNTGNITLTNIVAYNILPYVGDTGVLNTSQPRGSQWQPIMSSQVSASSGSISVQYSRSTNPCRTEILPSGPAGCSNDWTSTPPTDLSEVRALRFDLGSSELGIGETVSLNWRMFTFAGVPYFKTAFNSVSFIGEAVGTGIRLLPTEPNKVGVQVLPNGNSELGGTIFQDDNANGLIDTDEVGISGVTVELWIDEDDDGLIDPLVDTYMGVTTTDSVGEYIFRRIFAGNYIVDVTDEDNLLADMLLTTEREPEFVTVADDDIVTGIDFGYANRASGVDVYIDVMGPDSVRLGNELVWDIEVGNIGRFFDAENVEFSSTFPSDLESVSFSVQSSFTDDWNCVLASGRLDCTATKSLEPDYAAQVTIRATVPADYTATSILNEGEISTTTEEFNLTNNEDSLETQVPLADLSVEITANPADTVLLEDKIIWSITATNDGPQDAESAVVVAPIPTGAVYNLDFVESNGWVCSDTPFEVRCEKATLLNGTTDEPVVTFSTRVPGTYDQDTITAETTISAFTDDLNTANNRDEATVNVDRRFITTDKGLEPYVHVQFYPELVVGTQTEQDFALTEIIPSVLQTPISLTFGITSAAHPTATVPFCLDKVCDPTTAVVTGVVNVHSYMIDSVTLQREDSGEFIDGSANLLFGQLGKTDPITVSLGYDSSELFGRYVLDTADAINDEIECNRFHTDYSSASYPSCMMPQSAVSGSTPAHMLWQSHEYIVLDFVTKGGRSSAIPASDQVIQWDNARPGVYKISGTMRVTVEFSDPRFGPDPIVLPDADGFEISFATYVQMTTLFVESE